MVIERSFMHHIKVLKTFLKPVLQKTSRHLKEISSVNVSSSVWASEDQIFEFCQNLSDFNFGEVFMIRKVSLAIVSRRMSVIAPMVRKHLAIDVYTQVSNLSMRRSCTPHVVLLMVSQTIQKKGILILSPEPHLLPLRGAPTWAGSSMAPCPNPVRQELIMYLTPWMLGIWNGHQPVGYYDELKTIRDDVHAKNVTSDLCAAYVR